MFNKIWHFIIVIGIITSVKFRRGKIIMAEKTKLTKAGYKKLEEELRYLIDVVRDDVKRQLAEARAQGDLSENADYDSAKKQQAEIEEKIARIEYIKQNHIIIDDNGKKANSISLGSKVTVKYVADGSQETYTIVSTFETNPFEGYISKDSPLGSALFGKHAGDIVTVKAKSEYQVEIVRIEK